ncbi:MAG: N-acetyltransferase [Thiotrichales bacterium]|nr:N-acetyltransferase [Thiotrichales bacterium]
MTNYKIQFNDSLSVIPADSWNALNRDNNPFMRHEFLMALETHNCASERFGWIAHHLTVYDGDELIAAMPLYEKHNSYGEFVFDHSWADAWQRVGLPYFPKLVTSVPYSPVTGPRLLINPNLTESIQEKIWQAMVEQTQQFALNHGFSGWHCLFANQNEQAWLNNQDQFHIRNDCHFHWFNQNYTTFDDFLAKLTGKKRKNIRQERNSIINAGVTLRVLDGHTANDQDWADFAFFYHKTFTDKWSTPTLNEGFFKAVAQAMPKQVVLVLADNAAGECVAGSLMYRSDSVLYGRHWGCTEEIKNLHFEACYYQGIEYAIEHGLQRFEPGAGGEHKIARGFIPVKTQSAHWLAPNPFEEALPHFIQEEQKIMDHYYHENHAHSPYKQM